MEVIPVIEIKAGKSARPTFTRYDQPNVKRDDVLDIALRWKNEGAKRLHIHDIDGARVGMPQNRDQVREIVRRVGLPVQYSGGVRTFEVMQRILGWGVDRAVADADVTLDLAIKPGLVRLGEQAVLELRSFDGQMPRPGVPPGIWQDVYDYLREMNMMQGWPRFICRPIHGDGSLAMPIQEDVAKFLQQARKPVGVYARVRTTEEFSMLLQSGAESVLMGEALYDGTLNLPELLLAARRAAAAPPPQPAAPPPPSRPMPPGAPPQFGYRPNPHAPNVRPTNAPSRFPIPPPLPPLPPRKDHGK